MQIVLPYENSELRAVATQRESFPIKPWETLPNKVEFELARLLEKELYFNKRLEEIKTEIEHCNDYSAVGVFQAINVLNHQYLDNENIKKFLKKANGKLKNA
jgi:ribosome-binding factor A